MGVFVPLRQAALQFGVSDDTLRRRIKAGTLPAQREETVSGFRWLVEVDVDVLDDGAPHSAPHADPQGAAAEPAPGPQHAAGNGNGSGEVAALRELVEVLREELDARRREVAELHVLLQRSQLAPVAAATRAEAPHVYQSHDVTDTPPRRPRPWWWRLIFRAE